MTFHSTRIEQWLAGDFQFNYARENKLGQVCNAFDIVYRVLEERYIGAIL